MQYAKKILKNKGPLFFLKFNLRFIGI
jgi:hypothetical protein